MRITRLTHVWRILAKKVNRKNNNFDKIEPKSLFNYCREEFPENRELFD